METIKELFDNSRDIYRTIEKVITYKSDQKERLKNEISEYVATKSIEEQLHNMLEKMQNAMEDGGENEVGVWVSGFYGSGKSSFTKYLGLALDESVEIDGKAFIQHFQDRLSSPKVKALLGTVSNKFPAAVVLLDLASEMLAGATMEDVSTVLYYKVLQWAGYSRNIKVASFERKLKKDGKYDQFLSEIEEQLGVEWRKIQNDPLVVDSLIPDFAHKYYPKLFKTPSSFNTESNDIIRFENERVQEMINIVRETTGKVHILFIIDEVGQYVGSRQNLILNLDGLAKNLKNIGDGKVWIIGTAQQTLMEDDPKAALNSPELYKLKDRFPIQVDLESNDIKEICYRRLLGKSSAGNQKLKEVFEKKGQELRLNTALKDAKYYDSDFNEKTFINLYPFLPAHFSILLHLLGALAKSTGGIGLRSAIKIVQDILIEKIDGEMPVSDKEIGWLATTVTLYDSLKRDIQRTFPSIYNSVNQVIIRFPDSEMHQSVAKTVGILQILGNIPVNAINISGLMHPGISSPSLYEKVVEAIENMTVDPHIPFGEQEGSYKFFSEKLNDIEIERSQLPLRSIELKKILNEVTKNAFTPIPNTRLNNSLSINSGLKILNSNHLVSIYGDRDSIQMIVELVNLKEYENEKLRLIDESRQRAALSTIYLIGRDSDDVNDKLAEIYRCQEIVNRNRNEHDAEIKEYCASQIDRSANLEAQLTREIKRIFLKGSFIFRGNVISVDSLGEDLIDCCKSNLAKVAEIVYERHFEAPTRVETTLAEKFLKTSNLLAIDSKLDPLSIVKVYDGIAKVDIDNKCLVSIRDYIERNGTTDGKRLLDHFSNPPFGWSPDTVRYLIAGLLIASEIKIKIGGREITVNGQNAIDALKTNNTFKNIGLSLREERPSNEVLARSAERLTKIFGENIVPLEDEISKAVTKYLPSIQQWLGPLGEKIKNLQIMGEDRLESISKAIRDILITDASDAPGRFGGESSELYDDLIWAQSLNKAFKRGLNQTLKVLFQLKSEVDGLPKVGVSGELKEELAQTFESIGEKLKHPEFFDYEADFNTLLTQVETSVEGKKQKQKQEILNLLRSSIESLLSKTEWQQLSQEQQNSILSDLDNVKGSIEALDSKLADLISMSHAAQVTISKITEKVTLLAHDKKLADIEEQKSLGRKTFIKQVRVPRLISSKLKLVELSQKINELVNEIDDASVIEISIDLEG